MLEVDKALLQIHKLLSLSIPQKGANFLLRYEVRTGSIYDSLETFWGAMHDEL